METALDPEIAIARAAQMAAVAPFDITCLPIAEARERANESASLFCDGQPLVERVEDFFISCSAAEKLRVRLYQARGSKGRGAVLYAHGGGWFSCNVDTHDRMLRTLARESGLSVVAVDYRLSPENRFPAALDDMEQAWHWMRDSAGPLSIDAKKIAVAGDSVGANLALALQLYQRDNGYPMPVAGVLLYGCFAPNFETESHRRFGSGQYGLSTDRMRWHWSNYLGSAHECPPPLAAPLRADLTGLPPQFVGIAEMDAVSDDSRQLVDRLLAAKVTVQTEVWQNASHAFLQYSRDVAIARRALAQVGRFLSESLEN